MDDIKCPNCGFVNFVKYEYCRKCQRALVGGSELSNSGPSAPLPFQVPPPKSGGGFPIFKVSICSLVGLCLLCGLFFLSSAVADGMRRQEPPTSKIPWREFRPAEQGVGVMMPGETKAHQAATPVDSAEPRTYTSIVVGQGSAMYSVVRIPSTFSPTNPLGDRPSKQVDKILYDQLSHVLANTNATLVSQKTIYNNSKTAWGLEFEIQPPGSSRVAVTRGFGKMFFAGNTLVLLLITAEEGSDLLSEKETFLHPVRFF
jgi:hypothetical protein